MRALLQLILYSLIIIVSITSANAKPLLVGVPSFMPPFVMQAAKDNEYVGFDIEIISEVCKRIKQECVFKAVDFNKMLEGVLYETLDIGIGAITTTNERKKVYVFSLPYLQSSAQFIARADSPISDIPELEGKTLGIMHAYLYSPLVEKELHGNVKYKYYNLTSDQLVALSNKEVDAIIVDAEAALSMYAINENLKLVGPKLPLGLGYGIILAKKRGVLISEVNNALLDMEEDGSYMRIYKTYFANIKDN